MPLESGDQSRQHAIPRPAQQHLDHGYGQPARPATNEEGGHGRFHEDWDASQRGSSIIDGDKNHNLHRTPSVMSQSQSQAQAEQALPRRGTLKKKASLRRNASRRSSRAGSVRSLALQPEPHDEMHSAFYSPIPTTGNPTEHLANRFTAWRKLLKDLIAYFREVQNGYDHRSKSIVKISNLASSLHAPPNFLQSGGINDAIQMLSEYHKQTILESNKAKLIEEDVIQSLTGLRSDLQQKIKEIKNLSGDFKNSVDKEMDVTRRAVRSLEEALGQSDIDAAAMTGKQDPYLLRLAVDRQLERQLDEENYLHQAYLNLETSGRELEAIVVGEIQKAYSNYAGILKREADDAYNAIENLRTGPIAMPKDYEWNTFIEADEHFVDPRVPVRRFDMIHYPGRDHELAQEVRAGLLERKSKYLKSYTPGWYVLSPTHLHEFKTADKSQAPIMSLYLPEQKLGSHSEPGSTSNKFMLKGRQTGSMHRGHSWVFRAESYDTMMAWYEDIKSLTEAAPQERNAFVRSHARSFSGQSQRAASISSDGVMDEEDEEPFSTSASAVMQTPGKQETARRPEPGGRFPSDIQVDPARGLRVPLSPSSASSSIGNQNDRDAVAAAAVLPGSGISNHYSEPATQLRRSGFYTRHEDIEQQPSHARQLQHDAQKDGMNPYTYEPINQNIELSTYQHQPQPAQTDRIEAHQQQPAAPAMIIGAIHKQDQGHHEVAKDEPVVDSTQIPTAAFEKLAMQEAATIAAHDRSILQQQQQQQQTVPNYADIPLEQQAMQETVTIPGDDRSILQQQEAAVESVEKPVEKQVEHSSMDGGVDGACLRHHDLSLKDSEMHVPGEYPQPTPATEDEVVFS